MILKVIHKYNKICIMGYKTSIKITFHIIFIVKIFVFYDIKSYICDVIIT